jgi:hypothetical protein
MKARAGDYAREEPFMSLTTRDSLDAALAHMHEVRAKDPRAFVFRPEGIESLAILFGFVGNDAAARQAAELAVEEFPAPGRPGRAWPRRVSRSRIELVPARPSSELALQPGDARLSRALEGLSAEAR